MVSRPKRCIPVGAQASQIIPWLPRRGGHRAFAEPAERNFHVGKHKSFADDLNTERGIVSTRVAFALRSAEIQPPFLRFVQLSFIQQFNNKHISNFTVGLVFVPLLQLLLPTLPNKPTNQPFPLYTNNNKQLFHFLLDDPTLEGTVLLRPAT